MNAEYKYVVKPLADFLNSRKKKWTLRIPQHHTSETGWDIEASSKSIILLIEAKFLGNGPFLSKLNSLVTAPLANRKKHFLHSTKPSVVCWALGAKNMKVNLFQRIWDYFERNPVFWKHYYKDLKVKYIFLVSRGKVVRIDFKKLLELTPLYRSKAKNRDITKRREVAKQLIQMYFKKAYKILFVPEE